MRGGVSIVDELFLHLLIRGRGVLLGVGVIIPCLHKNTSINAHTIPQPTPPHTSSSDKATHEYIYVHTWLERSWRDCTPSTKEMASIRFDLLWGRGWGMGGWREGWMANST